MAVDHAREEAADTLEAEARRRAIEGVEEPVFHKGERVGTVRKHSDLLLIFLLKGARPQKFRDNYQRAGTGAPDGTPRLTPINTSLPDPPGGRHVVPGLLDDD